MSEKEYLLEQVDGSKVELRELQKVSLELLDYFDQFCREHGLSYTLCGGGCIGALRHGGFIPWDDDLDVHMLRGDYERLSKIWKENAHSKDYHLVRTTEDIFCDTMLTQISDQNTTFIKKNQTHLDIDHGVKLEIIPLDGAPEGRWKRRVQLFWALIFYLFNRGFAPENRGRLARYMGKVLLFFIRSKKGRAKVWKFAQKQMTKYPPEDSPYLSELCVTWKYMKLRYPREIFQGERRVLFQGRKLPIPFRAEEYLSMAFGNYLELPPEKERVPKHDAAFIDLHQPYRKYRGIYYASGN